MDNVRASKRGLIKEWSGYSSGYGALVRGAIRDRKEFLTWTEANLAFGVEINPSNCEAVLEGTSGIPGLRERKRIDGVWVIGTGRCLRRGYRVQ